MKKEMLRKRYIELLCQCGYDINKTLELFKKIPYNQLDVDFIKGRINWLINEYQITEQELEKI